MITEAKTEKDKAAVVARANVGAKAAADGIEKTEAMRLMPEAGEPWASLNAMDEKNVPNALADYEEYHTVSDEYLKLEDCY